MDYGNKWTNNLIGGFLVVALAALLFVGCNVALIDHRCYSETGNFFAIYPDAEVVSTEYNFIRARGIGRTVVHLQSDDAPLAVNSWYINHYAQYIRERGRISRAEHHVMRAPDDADHTTDIYLVSHCLQAETFQR